MDWVCFNNLDFCKCGIGYRAILVISSLFLSPPPSRNRKPARPELQGNNAVRVLRLAGATVFRVIAAGALEMCLLVGVLTGNR